MGMLVKVKGAAEIKKFLQKRQFLYKSKYSGWIPWWILAIPYLIYWWFVFLSVMYILFIPIVETSKGFVKGVKVLLAEPEVLIPAILMIISALFIILRMKSKKNKGLQS